MCLRAPFCLLCLVPRPGRWPLYTPGVSWIPCSLLYCFPCSHPGGWKRPSGWELTSVMLPVSEARTSWGQAPIEDSSWKMSFVGPGLHFHPQALNLFTAVTQSNTVHQFLNTNSNSSAPPSQPMLLKACSPHWQGSGSVAHPTMVLWEQLGHRFLTTSCFPAPPVTHTAFIAVNSSMAT